MRRRPLALWVVAAAGLVGCAPAGSFRPLIPLQPDRNLEVGAGYVAISPRPVGEDPWQQGGQAWSTLPLSIFDLALIGAFDFEGRATAGLNVRVRAFESQHANVGAGIELGYGWVAFELPMAVGSDRVWIYTAPQLGTWGHDETARLPVGVDLRVHDALHVRTEAQVNYPELDGYQRRIHLGVGLAYEL